MKIVSNNQDSKDVFVLLKQQEALKPLTTIKKLGLNPTTSKLTKVNGLLFKLTV